MIRLFGSVLCVAASCASCSDARTNRTSAAEDRLPAIEALQADGLYEETIDELRLMLDVQPDLPRASHLLGVAYLHTGQGGRAVWPLMRASRHPGFERDSGLLLAAVLASSQNWEAAADEADLVLTVAPGDREALLLRAEARLGLRDPEAALPDLERAVESDPRDSRALAMRARVLEEVGRIEDAQRAYDAMLEVTVETRDPLAATRACLVRAGFLVRTSPDAESTVLAVLSCVEAWSDDVAALAGASALLLELEREDDAIELWL
ncbi:MAG: tetratricopeptide repeat protein, partial [Gemmatimonadota bacterium]